MIQLLPQFRSKRGFTLTHNDLHETGQNLSSKGTRKLLAHFFDESLTTYASSSPVPQSLLGDGLSSSYPSPPAGTPR